jgi:hypothetical protein
MKTIRARVRNGHLVSVDPVDWPEGTEMELSPLPTDQGDVLHGMSEEEQGDSPEAIERWLAAFDAIPAATMTAEEEAAWLADRKAQREYELANQDARAERLRGHIE